MAWVDDTNSILLTDLYELTMLQSYFAEDMRKDAVFSLFVRRLPENRNFLIACGLEQVLDQLANLRFSEQNIAFLRDQNKFTQPFLDTLKDFRFSGSVHAVAEGTPVFENEPILEVVAPIGQAQVVETFIMNQVHVQTVSASKAARVVAAAQGRAVVDFGARRMQGADAAIKAARAFFIAGVDATSNVLAGELFGIPITGTMAHSYIEAFEKETDAFDAFIRSYPDTVLLVDTYDTLEGVRRVVALAERLGPSFRVRAIRLDSGDLIELAFKARQILDDAGLSQVQIFASGGLDEHVIARIVAAGAPIDGFGVGTAMAVSDDAPGLDIAYKLCAYAGQGRLKLSAGKPILPSRKQVFRVEQDGRAVRDIIARDGEAQPGRPLLRPVMKDGQVLADALPTLSESRTLAASEFARLPEAVRSLDPATPPYPVVVSDALLAHQEDVRRQVGA